MIILHRFFNAWVFYTRFPAPSWVDFNDEHLNRGSAFFPLLGLLLAAFFYFSYSLFNLIFPHEFSLLLAMAIGLLSTGAFHEDGFADLCDGFGGGWKTEDVLRIMKDSRLGTYGVCGLIFIIGIKWQALVVIEPSELLVSLLLAFALSRAWSISLVAVLPYVQQDQLSKAKPIAKAIHKKDLVFAWLFAVIPLLVFSWTNALVILAFGAICFVLIRSWFHKRLGGYTGDALGASQQIQENLCYLVLLALQGL